MNSGFKKLTLTPPKAFPIDVLPVYLQFVIRYVIAVTQAPMGLVGAMLLSVMGAAVQDSCNVRVKDEIQYLTTLYIIVIAKSGERKSRVFALLSTAIRALAKKLREEYTAQLLAYDVDLKIWTKKDGEAEKAFIKALKDETDFEEREKIFRRLQTEKPTPPLHRKLMLNDISTSAIKQEIGRGNASFSIMSDEAGLLFKNLLQETSDLNNWWSTGAITMERGNRIGIDVDDARVGLTLMLQDKAFQKYISTHGEVVRDNGFLARCLISKPESTQGTRFQTDTANINQEHFNSFNDRVTNLFLHSIERRKYGEKFHTIVLSDQALEYWHEMYLIIESNLGVGGTLEKYQDYSSKLLEHATRIAAIIEVFTHGHVEEVSLASMKAGYAIANYYMDHFIELMSTEDETSITTRAKELDAWLKKNVYWKGYTEIDKNYIRQCGPSCIRGKDLLDPTLELLKSEGKVKVYKSGNTMKVIYCQAAALHDYRSRAKNKQLNVPMLDSLPCEDGRVTNSFDREDLDKVPEYRPWPKQY